MHRTSLILLGAIVGLFCGFCHAEKVGNVDYHETEIVSPMEVEEALDLKYQELRAHRIELLAWLIMKENGLKDSDCMQATAQTALNRERDGRWGDLDTICKSSAYAQHYNGEPNAECWAVAEWVIDHPSVFPVNMFYFREGDYHHWEGVEDYIEIDGTCFSTEGKPIWE